MAELVAELELRDHVEEDEEEVGEDEEDLQVEAQVVDGLQTICRHRLLHRSQQGVRMDQHPNGDREPVVPRLVQQELDFSVRVREVRPEGDGITRDPCLSCCSGSGSGSGSAAAAFSCSLLDRSHPGRLDLLQLDRLLLVKHDALLRRVRHARRALESPPELLADAAASSFVYLVQFHRSFALHRDHSLGLERKRQSPASPRDLRERAGAQDLIRTRVLAHPRRRVGRVPVHAVERPVRTHHSPSCWPAVHPDLEVELRALHLVVLGDADQLSRQVHHAPDVAPGVRLLLQLLVEGPGGSRAHDDVPVADVLILVHAMVVDSVVELLEDLVENLEDLSRSLRLEQLLRSQGAEHDDAEGDVRAQKLSRVPVMDQLCHHVLRYQRVHKLPALVCYPQRLLGLQVQISLFHQPHKADQSSKASCHDLQELQEQQNPVVVLVEQRHCGSDQDGSQAEEARERM
mmetsp:Transcript_469/g.1051  ORF Transcript_469/g.1051 Transcript_469/m.1051 type:complete len:460 (-) Transcript_469:108-1487(-)